MTDIPRPIALAWATYATKDSVQEYLGVYDDIVEALRQAFFFGATIAIGKVLDGSKKAATDQAAREFLQIIDELHEFLHADDHHTIN